MTGDFDIQYFKDNGFLRQRCTRCGAYFWSLGRHEVCGEAPCAEYEFISRPAFKERLNIHEMRKKYLRFFENRGHTVIGRYPIVARWREDTFFTNATIYAFQPWVISGIVDPPANPLVMSQTCVRFNDIDNVGVTGRHLTMFEMMAHHAFNPPGKEVYFKERTVELCHELLVKELGTDPEIIKYKEEWWEGGGNSGPSLSVGVRGLELATLVFMQYEGSERKPMGMTVVDTGYGLERFTWVSRGTPNVYEASFPDVVDKIRIRSGISKPDEETMKTYAKFAGMEDITSGTELKMLRGRVASILNRDVRELEAAFRPLEMIYSIADHMRASVFLINDGVLPSNVKAGYFLRLIIRRALRCIEFLGCELTPAEVAGWHIDSLCGAFPELKENTDSILKIIEVETKKYQETVRRGRELITRMMKKKQTIDLDELIRLYDSHGLTPDTVKKITGLEINVPDDFFGRVAVLHEKTEKEYGSHLPEVDTHTELLCYDLLKELKGEYRPEFEFDAHAVRILPATLKEGQDQPGGKGMFWIVLDRTYFYPEGGGQESDHGEIILPTRDKELILPVLDVQRSGKGVLHLVSVDNWMVEHILTQYRPRKKVSVRCRVDVRRRVALMRHHTAAHIINGVSREILGRHVWQSGAHKSAESARLDITHFDQIDEDTLAKIEARANEIVMEDLKVSTEVMERTKAEQKYGFTIYQGGFIPGKDLRIVTLKGFDAEACGGTHCERTGQVGVIKITGAKRIQDGIVRLEFVAGEPALTKIREKDVLVRKVAGILNAPEASLIVALRHLIEEKKDLEKKMTERVKQEAESAFSSILSRGRLSGGCMFLVSTGEYDAETLEMVSQIVSTKEKIISILNPKGGLRLYVTRGKGVPFSAREILQKICKETGGSGGGTDDFARGELKDPSKLNGAVERIFASNNMASSL